MKHILVILFSVVTLSAFGQQGSASFSVLRQKLTATSGDTTSSAFNTAVSNAVSSGYAVQFWNNVATTPHYDFINSEGTQHVFSFSGAGGNFWKTAGSTTLTASTTIAGGGFPLFFTNLDSIRVFTNGGQQFIADNGGMLFDASDSLRFSVQHFHIEATHGILLDSDPGTSGFMPTSGGTNQPTTWTNPHAHTSTALTDGATITITGLKHTLTSDEATVTWTLSQTSDFQTTDIILNATSTTWTFPAGALCVVDGVASGTNTAALTGVSGDHHIMSIYKDGTNYRVVIKNFGQ